MQKKKKKKVPRKPSSVVLSQAELTPRHHGHDPVIA
tara:strand:+ start:199 stop:306 length:108 start_codon:yes stop_codon:yes gene_type:complete